MNKKDYIQNFVVFDDKDNFVGSFNSCEEIIKCQYQYPDNYTVYCRGHFVKHIKEFKNLKKVELDELENALDAFSMAFYGLFC